MAAKSGKFDVFIAHEAHDKAWTRDFARSLKHRGLSVWFSEDEIRSESELGKKIKEGLKESENFVSVVTERSLENPVTLFELGTALGLGKKMVLIAPDELERSDLPPGLREKVVITKQTPAKTAAELIRRELSGRVESRGAAKDRDSRS